VTTPPSTGSTAGRAVTSTPVGLGEGSPLFGALRILPIERLNSILVVTPRRGLPRRGAAVDRTPGPPQ
jgi:general secretion pathway protein D